MGLPGTAFESFGQFFQGQAEVFIEKIFFYNDRSQVGEAVLNRGNFCRTGLCEIIDKYHPKNVYFDWWIQHSALRPYLRKFAAYYYNRVAQWGSDAVINYKHDAFLFGTVVPDVERGQFADMKPYFWQPDTAIARNSWRYTENNDFRPGEDIICDLVDIVSKNGCLLLNVGPKPDGIKKNFTSQDFRFTTANGYPYAIAMKRGENGEYCIRCLGIQDASKQANFHGIIREVDVLGSTEKPRWSRDEAGLHISSRFSSDSPVVFRLELE